MALKWYRNRETGETIRSLKPKDPKLFEELVEAPNQKFMITANENLGTSKIKNQDKILKARARNYSRDVDIDDNIQINRLNGLDAQVNKNLLNTKGQRRRKIDDI